ncbi:MAG: carboxylesterase family protein [Armatimonadia bacterium]|nr:carboxylesterase family protein [Armatimonadia bacterium]
MRLATAVGAMMVLAVAVGCAEPVAIEVDGGRIVGTLTADGEVGVWKGVPYAAPPVGELRWRPPQPMEPWAGVRECTEFGPACPQPDSINPVGGEVGARDEDCLFLNVWAPAETDRPLPVMVWVHGGGCTTGAGSMSIYNGEQLARAGVVLITINYRLGPLGYLAHPLLSAESNRNVSGNYGMLDQIYALQWVQDNITAFGGDPDCVTIFGESAGGLSVARLLISPLSEGLFHRAIMQSGAARGRNRYLREDTGTMPSMESVGETLFEALGVADDADPVASARAVDAHTIIETANPQLGLIGDGTKYGPVVDGWAVPDPADEMFADGRFHDVPIIAGANADDGSIFATFARKLGPRAYEMLVRRMAGEQAGDLLRLIPAQTRRNVPQAVTDLMTIGSFAAPARSVVKSVNDNGGDAWLYHFTRAPEVGSAKKFGAFHGLEIAYIFGVGKVERMLGETDRALSEAMRATWVRFAETGDPNGEGIPRWPQWSAETEACIYFGEEITTGRAPWVEACEVLDAVNG